MTEIKTFDGISIVTFSNIKGGCEFFCDVLKLVAVAGINVDMISQIPPTSDRISFGFTFSDEEIAKLLVVINNISAKHKITPLVNSGNVKIVIKAKAMENQAGFAAKVFAVLNEIGAAPLLVTTGIDEISLLVNDGYANEIVYKLEQKLA